MLLSGEKMLSQAFLSHICLDLCFEGRMWDLIVSVPDHCLSSYFAGNKDSYKSSNEFEFGPD